MSKSIEVVTVPGSVSELGARWSAAQSGSAVLLWRFARSVYKFVDANPKVKLAEVGAACATAAKRATPYSKGWVSRAVKSAKAFEAEPSDPASASKFSEMFYGHDSAKAKASSGATAEEALKGALAFAKLAVKRGMDAGAVESAVHDALA